MSTKYQPQQHLRHPLDRCPIWLTRWVGYRRHPPKKQPNYVVWFWSFIGAFSGLCVIQGVFNYSHYFLRRHVPGVIASYGASAVLVYGAIEAPLSQPRALVGGHFLAALTGICITKLFELMPDKERLDSLRWLAGSLSVATAIVIMQITGTTHPPAGATALLAAVNADVYEIGWYYLPVILLSSTLILVVALLVDNIQRRYPLFWFSPAEAVPAKVSADLSGEDVEPNNRQEAPKAAGEHRGGTDTPDTVNEERKTGPKTSESMV